MTRASERLIDVLVFAMLLVFGYLLRTEQPGLAGIIVAAGIGTWFQKNASAPHPTIEQAAALAAAKVLEVAKERSSLES